MDFKEYDDVYEAIFERECQTCGKTTKFKTDFGYVCSEECEAELIQRITDNLKKHRKSNDDLTTLRLDRRQRKIFSKLMYALTKQVASYGFYDFLKNWDIAEEDYNYIKKYLKRVYDVNTYV